MTLVGGLGIRLDPKSKVKSRLKQIVFVTNVGSWILGRRLDFLMESTKILSFSRLFPQGESQPLTYPSANLRAHPRAHPLADPRARLRAHKSYKKSPIEARVKSTQWVHQDPPKTAKRVILLSLSFHFWKFYQKTSIRMIERITVIVKLHAILSNQKRVFIFINFLSLQIALFALISCKISNWRLKISCRKFFFLNLKRNKN